eukprot:TRINITY_DN4656_c0_g1_i1.p1 TRINITY_DN4656_c0_g1~~TRINITY_DN4656_c0_g1_i1.p1  ORF type:complete len:297 (+),score=72.49 TRINITY_DN4656_c0_g1_i1:92-982(+)
MSINTEKSVEALQRERRDILLRLDEIRQELLNYNEEADAFDKIYDEEQAVVIEKQRLNDTFVDPRSDLLTKEGKKKFAKLFDMFDKDGDDLLNLAEFSHFLSHYHEREVQPFLDHQEFHHLATKLGSKSTAGLDIKSLDRFRRSTSQWGPKLGIFLKKFGLEEDEKDEIFEKAQTVYNEFATESGISGKRMQEVAFELGYVLTTSEAATAAQMLMEGLNRSISFERLLQWHKVNSRMDRYEKGAAYSTLITSLKMNSWIRKGKSMWTSIQKRLWNLVDSGFTEGLRSSTEKHLPLK